MEIMKAKEQFMQHIRQKGLRNTKQREEIVDFFFHINKHITADELYEQLKKKDPMIGQATVFRTLKHMCECGLADEIKIGRNKARFEQKYGHEHHDHLICTKCGRFIEIKSDEIEK